MTRQIKLAASRAHLSIPFQPSTDDSLSHLGQRRLATPAVPAPGARRPQGRVRGQAIQCLAAEPRRQRQQRGRGSRCHCLLLLRRGRGLGPEVGGVGHEEEVEEEFPHKDQVPFRRQRLLRRLLGGGRRRGGLQVLQQLQQPVRHGHTLPPIGPLVPGDPHQQRPRQPPLPLGVQARGAYLQKHLSEVFGEGAAPRGARAGQHGGAGHLEGAVRAQPLQEVGAALHGLVYVCMCWITGCGLGWWGRARRGGAGGA